MLFRFKEEFPDLYQDNIESIYCLGTRDCNGLESRVDWQTFKQVCQECDILGKVTEIDCENRGYKNVVGGFDVLESSYYFDVPRSYFTAKLAKVGVNVILNHRVIIRTYIN